MAGDTVTTQNENNHDLSGLTIAQVIERQSQFGFNELNIQKKSSLFKKILSIFKEPMFLLLFGTSLIYFFLGEWKDGVIMLFFVAFMAGINIIQEWRTDRTLGALRELSSPRISVRREGKEQIIASRELVPDDIMLLYEGDRIPADGEVVLLHDLGVDESSLTGESDIVWKQMDKTENGYFRRDHVYAGTTITQGSAEVRVTATGKNTEYGKIGVSVAEAPDRPTPLEKQTRKLVKTCTIIGLCLLVLAAVITYEHTLNIVDSIIAGITLAMAMLPEEFPVILTVFLALGASRMAKKHALIRRMPSVETLGAVTVLCVDKTGTLTENMMRCEEITPLDGFTQEEILKVAVLASEKNAYDPMEHAIMQKAAAFELDTEGLHNNELLFEYAFTSCTRRMGHVWMKEGSKLLAVKGAPESVLPLCNISDEVLSDIRKKQAELAYLGYRVLAVARYAKDLDYIPEDMEDLELEAVGLLSFVDPPRQAVPEAVKRCTRAGIRIVMITGDNPLTARSIADSIGLPAGGIITGDELDKLQNGELTERLKGINIFARVLPQHKMQIVKALKAQGEIVAMTGDGVNDAPALKYADIGIAMGRRGTEVAREAADMVLLDDNFTTIVDSVNDGRRIYDNIRKAVGYVFVVHIPIALAALLAPIMHLPVLLLPVHVVLLELIIDPTCSIVFERQPQEKNIMERPPRPIKEPLITPSLMVKSVLQGLAIFIAVFAPYYFIVSSGMGTSVARSFSLVVLMLSNLMLVFINRSEHDSIFRRAGKGNNRVTIMISAIVTVMITAMLYIPWISGIVQTAPLDIKMLLYAIGFALVSTVWWEAIKFIQRRILKKR